MTHPTDDRGRFEEALQALESAIHYFNDHFTDDSDDAEDEKNSLACDEARTEVLRQFDNRNESERLRAENEALKGTIERVKALSRWTPTDGDSGSAWISAESLDSALSKHEGASEYAKPWDQLLEAARAVVTSTHGDDGMEMAPTRASVERLATIVNALKQPTKEL